MMIFSATWRCITTLLIFSIRCFPLLRTGSMELITRGYLTVEPAPPYRLFSNLTVYCHVDKCEWGSKIYLELKGLNVNLPNRSINCTTTIFYLSFVTPQALLVCKLKHARLSDVVNGLELQAGLPPDKPQNIICETTRSSDFIVCSWQKGNETHLETSYNISIFGQNGSQIHSEQIKDIEEISISRAILAENIKYSLVITAYNHLGKSPSDPFSFSVMDVIVIPKTPRIVKIEFGNYSNALLHWNTSEFKTHLRPQIRLRAENISWENTKITEGGEALIRVDNLRPLTEYELQMRVCDSGSGPTLRPRNQRSLCSKWSLSMWMTSPGKSLSQPLHVWRISGGQQDMNGLKNVTVLWKHPPPEDYSGEVQQYTIFVANDRVENCTANSSQCSVQVPGAIQALSVSAVTLYGMSPPAEVEIRNSGLCGPTFGRLAPSADGNAVLVSWKLRPEKVLYYVIEWTSIPAGWLQWKKLTEDVNNTSITGLTAGVRYNVSLYAVTTGGVSAPSFTLIYSREQKPLSAPTLRVLAHKSRRILIQCDELPVDQQRGNITNYTIYMQTLDFNSTEVRASFSPEKAFESGSREMWLDCPEGALALQMTASNAAGEGPRGNRIPSQPAAPPVGKVIVIVFIIAIFITILTNLMCCSCVRERIKQKCISWGPSWLVKNVPKPGRSNAIRLLKEDRGEAIFSYTDSDPPLSPIIMVSQEMDEVYPVIHVEVSKTGFKQPTAERSSSATDVRMTPDQDTGYKPQIASFLLEEVANDTEENEEENAEEDGFSSVCEGLLRGLLASVNVDFSGSSQGLILDSVGGLLRPKTTETSAMTRVFLQETMAGDDVEADSRCLDFQQDDSMTCDTADTCSPAGETTLNGSYFPQAASVSAAPLNTERSQGGWEC